MSILSDNSPALILIDIQQGFDDLAYWGGERNNLNAEQNANKLLTLWRQHHLPIFHIQHCSSNPESLLHISHSGNRFKDLVKPLDNEVIIQKNVNSAFIGTSLQAQLEEQKIDTIVILGLTTEHCVSTTARMAGNLGFKTFVVTDATAAFNKTGPNGEKYPAQLIHDTAIAMLHQEFATIITTREIEQSLSPELATLNT